MLPCCRVDVPHLFRILSKSVPKTKISLLPRDRAYETLPCVLKVRFTFSGFIQILEKPLPLGVGMNSCHRYEGNFVTFPTKGMRVD